MANTAIRSSQKDWARLYQLWIGQGKPGQVILGEDSFQVATPDGDDDPAFIPMGSHNAYASTSVVQDQPEQKPKQTQGVTRGKTKGKA